MDSLQLYEHWKTHALEDPALLSELEALDPVRDRPAMDDRFYRELEFGTGGLRGVLGAGTNRMNIYVVRRATQGLCGWLRRSGLPQSVAIGYDSRINSERFARETARVLAANQITAWLYPRLEPTPALSWAVRYLGCGAGVCITASHNPAAYNGYKVYGSDGCQITPEAASAVLAEMREADPFEVPALPFDEGLSSGRIRMIGEDCLEAYLDAVQAQSVAGGRVSGLKIVYTPLNGSGLECVTKILRRIGITDLTVVPEQEQPDGNFPTCPYPNPEIREAMECGLALCKKVRPDLLIGTDPDCDRMGAAVPDGDGYTLISGNEMGVLLLDYVCRRRMENGTMPERPVAVTTIVSTGMADAVAAKYGVELRRVLTGFKFIGEQLGILERDGETGRYILGFEESYGYLSGGHVRDKDAVNASMLACEMAAWYREKNQTLADAMRALYAEFGCCHSALESITFEGAEGMAKMQSIMAALRDAAPGQIGGQAVTGRLDYLSGEGVTGDLPRSDVLEFRLEHGRVIVRPSGTEPKLKIYLSASAETMEQAETANRLVLQELRGGWLG